MSTQHGIESRAQRSTALLALLLVLRAGGIDAQVVPITIVSVGDSYASGEGAPDLAGPSVPLPRWRGDNRDLAAVRCHRSNNAAPVQAARLVASIRPVSFWHFACSGSRITDLTAPGSGQLATAASHVAAPIDALIISIGGNDVDFAGVVGGCLALPCQIYLPDAFPGAVTALAPSLSSLVIAVAKMPVPVRHVFVTEYPEPSTTPFPGPAHRCGSIVPPTSPNIPASGFDDLYAAKAESAAKNVVEPLNAQLLLTVSSAQTIAPGGPIWHFVPGISAAFATHGYCMGLPNPAPQMLITGRMINTLTDSEFNQGDINGTMHPNVTGNAAAGSVIAGAILANVPIVAAGAPPPPPSCVTHDSMTCPGYCDRHPTATSCPRMRNECLNRHVPGCT